jgi:hypothetical protein
MNVNEEQLNQNNINADFINNINNNNFINNQVDLIPLNDFPVVEVNEVFFTATQLLQELNNWIEGDKIRTYLNAMISVELLNIELDGGVIIHQNIIDNINNNFQNAENIIFTDEQGEYIEKVSKFIELCDMDEMRDFIVYMNLLF